MSATHDPWGTHDYDIDAYLDAIGVGRESPGLDYLERLHHAHVHAFPFTNLNVLLGPHPGVSPAVVQDQLLSLRRGGYCFEHAQIFAAVLERLGFTVVRRLGRVFGPSNGRTHMVVLVELDGAWYFNDPAFSFSITGPLPLRDGASREAAGRTFRLVRGTVEEVTTWTLERDAQLQHITDSLPVVPADVHGGHHLTSTLPGALFTRTFVASRWVEDSNVIVTHQSRTVRRAGHQTQYEELSPADAVDAARELGIPIAPEETERLARIVERFRREE